MDISDQDRAERSAQAMLANDTATQGLGMELEAVGPGTAQLRMCVGDQMLNGHSTCHGGYLFTLADSAFAVACNTFNQVAVASSASIEFMAPAYAGDVLTAEASLQSQGRRTGLYDVIVSNQKQQRIALFRGRSHRIGKPLFDENAEA
ncbi:hydroxyphenylacetyl-CoA thioesterase PaaI [Granulosicoccus antarcticus]|uniref:Acyl-coenzyme A thioesterase PaaI n=1 Tax=Granulosicoccus antarcticus IMCC3135 TaxID=1192854 RepID=A0A2Z2NZH2_9GAMM|nr:hydroxyphenylacetyl-CoA thioesterase PaaI [Granulosicoccus antarcticus]ASJ76836.1 Acyl-coenzyme A thioesterase PaaI [Granulosicoccus antarcticus IMCC3135]